MTTDPARWEMAQHLDFAWFQKAFQKWEPTLIDAGRFEAGRIRGVTLEDFLLEGP